MSVLGGKQTLGLLRFLHPFRFLDLLQATNKLCGKRLIIGGWVAPHRRENLRIWKSGGHPDSVEIYGFPSSRQIELARVKGRMPRAPKEIHSMVSGEAFDRCYYRILAAFAVGQCHIVEWLAVKDDVSLWIRPTTTCGHQSNSNAGREQK
jgi:hypothetical protein